jgi:Protein of unknown function (DUF5656)
VSDSTPSAPFERSLALRQVVGWSVPAIALAGLFIVPLLGSFGGGFAGIVVTALVGLLVGFAAEVHGRLHPNFSAVGDRFGYTLWILPDLLAVALGLALVFFQSGDSLIQRGLPLLGAILCGLALVAQDREIDASHDTTGWPRLVLSLLTYVAAFALFTMIYQTKERSIITATSTAILAGLLSVAMLRSTPSPRQRTLLYAGAIGLLAGEVTWALNYWVVLALVGGAVLLLLFYVLVGVVEGVLTGELTRRVLIEYSSVGLLGFLLILSTGPWRP